MQINFDDVRTSGHSAIEHSPASEELDELLFSPSFQNLDSETQDKILDKYADIGSYHEASRITGIPLGLDCATNTKPLEVIETPASVRLHDRANHLHKSLKEYSRASSNQGLIDKITDPSRVRASEIDWNHVDRLGGSARRHDRLGKEALAIAFGSIDELVAAGFSRAEVKQNLSEETSKFEDYYYNPKNNTDEEPEKNDNRRKALRKATKKYLDLPN